MINRQLTIAFCIFVFSLFTLHGQNTSTVIEKLKLDLNNNLSPKKEASIFSDLTWYYSTISIDSALHYGNKALHAATALSDSVLLAQVFSDIGAVYFRKGDFNSSKKNYLNAYAIRKAKNDVKGLAKINNNLANIYEKQQQYELAMTTFLEALAYFESIDDTKNIHIIKGNIGLILYKTKNYDKAFNYINDVVKYQIQTNATQELCISYLNLGNVYLELKDTVNALKMYNNSVRTCKAEGNKSALSSGYNNIATIKASQKKSQEALKFYQQTQKMRNELNSQLDKTNFDFNWANEFFQKNDLERAKSLFLSTESVFAQNKSYHKLQLNYNYLIQIYALQHKPDSVAYYSSKLIELNKSLLENARSENAAELETKYETLKKEKLLLEQREETRRQKFIVYRVSMLALIIAIIGFLIYRQQKLKHKQMAQAFELKLAIAEVEKQNKLQEQRLTISRDLHDNIGSHLTFIISSIENVKHVYAQNNVAMSDKLYGLGNFTRATIQELRDTIWAMNSNEISIEDLEMQLLGYINKAKEYVSGVSFEFQVQEDTKGLIFSSIQGMNIYRTLQEAINNSLKYANATLVSVDIAHKANITTICVTDNGKGFDLQTVNKGNGLRNMERRMIEIGGNCTIRSTAQGTVVCLELMDA